MGLEEIIANKIREKGAIHVSEFVELALYHPEFGYYNRRPPVIGKEGDFYTSSDLHPIFGMTIGRWLKEMGIKTVLEIGAGKGWLAHDILKEFHGDYLILERSEYLREIEREVLREFNNVTWIESIKDLKPFEGLVLANELFDAFPFDLFKRVKKSDKVVPFSSPRARSAWGEERGGGNSSSKSDDTGFSEQDSETEWYEILLKEGMEYELVDASKEDKEILKEYRESQFVVLPRGWDSLIRELSLRHRGKILVIDYGFERREYERRFPYGAIQTYRRHGPGGHFTKNPGEQDITFFVDFSLLSKVFESHGYRELRIQSQADFLIEIGIMDVLEDYEKIADEKEKVKARLAVKTLIMDFGTTFKVLQGWKE